MLYRYYQLFFVMFLSFRSIRAYIYKAGSGAQTSVASPPSSSSSSSSTLKFPLFRTYAKLSGGGNSESYRYDAVTRRNIIEDSLFCAVPPEDSHEVCVVTKSSYDSWISTRTPITKAWMKDLGISSAKFPSSKIIKMPVINVDEVDEGGSLSPSTMKHFLFVDDSANHSAVFDKVWSGLGSNKTFELKTFDNSEVDAELSTKLMTSFALSSYQFDAFKSAKGKPQSKLVWLPQARKKEVLSIARAYTTMKDLVNLPAMQLGPADIERAIKDMSVDWKAEINSVIGVESLLESNYPQIAAVGMAADISRSPRIVELQWRCANAKSTVVIIGKGVTFDTGGLNMKSGGGMRQMKKDMAGSAQAIALAGLVIENKLPLNVVLLVPLVENSISGIALRPGDVISARNGKTTEITNTDAEGRLILADAIVRATELDPDFILDFATLTGAARVALGADLPAVFSNDLDKLTDIWKLSVEVDDPLWMMPLHKKYKSMLQVSKVADMVNAVEGGLGGAITAALYLSEYLNSRKSTPSTDEQGNVCEDADDDEDESRISNDFKSEKKEPLWVHVDFMGMRQGLGEPQGLRAMYEYIKKTFVSQPAK